MNASNQPPLIVAVSGGIDSVVLLHQLVVAKRPLVVAHVNHGIRADSDSDEVFVRDLAAAYDVPFTSVQLKLAPTVSEEAARHARYTWLESVRAMFGGEAVATAHHQDDVIETIMINTIRGTGWRGLCSLRETAQHRRPLLSWSKAQVIAYALEHDLTWHEDSTNQSMRYLRNRLRHQYLPRLSAAERQRLLDLYSSQLLLRRAIDTEVREVLRTYRHGEALDRYLLIMVDDTVGQELLRAWLGMPLERPRLRDLHLFAKTAQNHAKWSLDADRFVVIKQHRLIVQSSRD